MVFWHLYYVIRTPNFNRNYLLNDIIGSIILGLIVFGFMASSLSATDSWLLASAQTLSWDLIDFKIFYNLNHKGVFLTGETNEKVTNRARAVLITLGVSSSIIIYLISLIWPDVFNLQFVMFGAGLSMIPALIFGLTSFKQSHKILSWTAFLSITFGLTTAIVLFILW